MMALTATVALTNFSAVSTGFQLVIHECYHVPKLAFRGRVAR